jgi:hypothetical protein
MLCILHMPTHTTWDIHREGGEGVEWGGEIY